MEKWIECVPNISEGVSSELFTAINNTMDLIPDVHLLDIDSGRSANRTVLTIVGKKGAMLEALFKIYKLSLQLIDMRDHKGVHPRIGAVDVCPFIPLQGSLMEDCIELSHDLGKKLEKELGISGYYYEFAATKENRKNLANCRSGEYEGIAKKLSKMDWKPDFGPTDFNPKQGLTIIGARPFLIAFNINLATHSIEIAKKISSLIRTSGKSISPHRLPAIKAIGWKIADFDRVQVSTNVIDFNKNSLFQVWNSVMAAAKKFQTHPTGCELIGLIPKTALIDTGIEFSSKEKEIFKSESEWIDLAIDKLNLSDLSPFDKDKRVLELALKDKLKS